MRRPLFRFLVASMAYLLVPGHILAQQSGNQALATQETRSYTHEHPLVYEDAWDLWPYVFLDEHGRPSGYNVDLIGMLMEELGIPYEVRLKPRRTVLAELKERKADLTLGMDAHFHNAYGQYGRSIIHLFTHSVLTPKSQPVVVRSLADLATHRVLVHEHSYSHDMMEQKGWAANAIPCIDMKDAVLGLSTNEAGQVLWNTACLTWLLKMYDIDNLQITPVNMPHGEYKFISHDANLLKRLDAAYSKLRADGELEEIQTKWFHPEQKDTGIPSWIWYLTATIGVVVLFLMYYLVSYKLLERHMQKLARQRTRRLAQILQTCKVRIWTFDVAQQTFTWMDRSGHPMSPCSSFDFSSLLHHDDFERLYDGIRKIAGKEKKSVTLELNSFGDENNEMCERKHRVVLSAFNSERGVPTTIIGTTYDVADEYEKQQHAKERLSRYMSVFNTAMVTLEYYDDQGYLVNVNERGQQTVGKTLDEIRAMKVNIRGEIEDSGFDIDTFDYYYATHRLHLNGGDGDGVTSPNVYYYEHQLVPVRDKNNKLLCVYGSGRDVSEMVRAYHQLLRSTHELQKATDEVTEYVKNINYVLGVGGVRMANYSPSTHTLTIFKGLNIVQLTLTQTRCMTLVDDQWKKEALKVLNNMDNRKARPSDLEVKTTLRIKGMPLYLQFRFIPTFDEQGQLLNYFGLCRDTSEMRNTDALLEKESARAQEVEGLKNSFLRNMSYEIRTPLNAVVGFAELFENEHEPEDEPIFIREIKDNSAHLLNLINDILFLSRLDAHMIEITRCPIDFSLTFEGYCHMGWANYQKEKVVYKVENHYNQLVVDIDDTNLGRVIEQITANAAQHTTEGTVRARYDYIADKLIIVVEDTGCGMSEKVLSQVYERFESTGSKGTGLGLPICKELIEQLGGSIDISSELGKGTTVWITMPCKAVIIDRKKDI